MGEGFSKNSNDNKEEIFSKVVRAGKRTYFFDVKTTRGNDYYITITESKKRFNDDGSFVYEKHKLFLYKEDFEKFEEGFSEVVTFIKSNGLLDNEEESGEEEGRSVESSTSEFKEDSFSDVKFEDI
jgi:Protein of unknown function (DUF3276)